MKRLLVLILLSVSAQVCAKKGLYEIVIANNTTAPMHYELKLAGLNNEGKTKKIKSKGQLVMPGDSRVFSTSYLLLADIDVFGKKVTKGGLTVMFKKGKRTIKKRYTIPVGQTGKDWIFAVGGANPEVRVNPFTQNWQICGSWAHTDLQHYYTLEAEIIGIAAGAATAVVGGILVAPELVPIAAGSITPLGTAGTATGGLLAGEAMILGGSATAAALLANADRIYDKSKKELGLSRKMRKDKCVKYKHKKK